MSEEKKNFANYGQESFDLSQQDEKERIVLNIQEETPVTGILLDTMTKGDFIGTGNPVIDAFKRINLYFLKHSKIKVADKATFFHLLSVMINSGMPMVRALKALSKQSDSTPALKLIIDDLETKISEGASLSEAMIGHPKVFSEQETGMIQAGEVSGQLSGVLETLAHDTEKSVMIKKKVKSALMYPMVIFTLLIAVVVIMLVYVIPQLTELFTSTGGELPLITRIVVGLSDVLIERKLQLIVGVLSIILFVVIFRRTEQGHYFFDKLKLKIPIFGKLIQKTYLARFARSLGNLLDSSVSIVKTLEITAGSVGNEVYRKRLLLSVEDIKQGIPLAENLTESDLFPPMLVSMIEVGEETAQLDTISNKIADFYEDEVDTAVAGISKIIEPVMLVIIGLTVGAVVAAIILPIMQLTETAGSL